MHVRAIAAGLALAGSALAGAIPGTTPVEPKITTTSFLDLYTHAPTKGPQPTSACPSCDVPHPKNWDPNWEKQRVLNDTTKHHKSFKLFAYPKIADSGMKLPVHVREHPDHKDVWNLKLAIPTEGRMDDRQPTWNLHNRGLETDKSATIKDKLYFRLWEPKVDTNNPKHYREMLTKDKNQKKYKKEENAKLLGKKSWSLVRDDKNPAAYDLVSADPAGKFFFCMDTKTVASIGEASSNPFQEDNPFDEEDPLHEEDPSHHNLADADKKPHLSMVLEKFLAKGLGHLIYSDDKPQKHENVDGFMLHINDVPQVCFPSVLKAEQWSTK